MEGFDIGLLVGFALGIIIAGVFLVSQSFDFVHTINKICSDKWGVNKYTIVHENNYVFCKPEQNESIPPFDDYEAAYKNSAGE